MESTIAQKLDNLTILQYLDTELDEIKKIRGALPDEVMDLEDEIAGYQTRIEKHNKEQEELEQNIANNKTAIKDAEKLIQKYGEQQMNVRNNREYDAITKEVELQQLEIQILEKRIKENFAKIEAKKEEMASTIALVEERKKDLTSKKSELDSIIAESEEEEQALSKKREKAGKNIDERLLKSYNRIRNNAKNGLGVVLVKRGACGGCFNIVPPQRQAEIRERKKIIVCEHCGRIFADIEDEFESEEKKAQRAKKFKSFK